MIKDLETLKLSDIHTQLPDLTVSNDMPLEAVDTRRSKDVESLVV